MKYGAAVTGLGALSSIGQTPPAMLESLRERRSGLHPIETFSTDGLRARHAGEIRDWRPREHFDAATSVRMDRNSQCANATSGLYAAAAALRGLRHGEAHATMDAGSSEFGHSSAVLFDGDDAQPRRL